MTINSTFTVGDTLPAADERTIKIEPMLHRADLRFAAENGGLLTFAFLHRLSESGWNPEGTIIDSRVHMLMPGMFPCIPGWHHDDVPREREDGQPNYLNPSYQSQHCMALWGDCSLTEFAVGRHKMPHVPLGQKVYKVLSPLIEEMCLKGELQRVIAPERRLIFFDWLAWHRGAETTKQGFRFFIRATRNTGLKARNEIRYNANVYMPVLDEGW